MSTYTPYPSHPLLVIEPAFTCQKEYNIFNSWENNITLANEKILLLQTNEMKNQEKIKTLEKNIYTLKAELECTESRLFNLQTDCENMNEAFRKFKENLSMWLFNN